MAVRITRAFALLLLGTYAGGVMLTVLAPSVFALPGPAYVRLWQAQNLDYGAAMPVLLLSCITLLIATSVLSRRQGRLVMALSVAATLLVVATVVLTVTQMEPLNVIANSWDPDRLPADWAANLETWRSLHSLRTVLAVAAFGALLASQVFDAARPIQPKSASASGSLVAG